MGTSATAVAEAAERNQRMKTPIKNLSLLPVLIMGFGLMWLVR
jgi:hypothetical protein